MDANRKYYFSPLSDEERLSFLKKAAEENHEIEAWQKGQDKGDVETFTIKGFDSATSTYDLSFNASLLSKLTGSKNKDQNVLIKISFKTIIIFGSGKVQYDKANDTYKMIVDQEIFKSQRRSNYRLMANKYIAIQIKLDEIVFDCIDISAGGTSFPITKDQLEKYQKDTIFNNVRIRLTNQQYDVPAVKIAGHWDHEFVGPKGDHIQGYKIGVAFEELPKDIEEELVLHINTEARGEELRKKNAEKKKS